VFQNNPDWILALQPDLAQAPGGYRFSAPVLKERERRLDGLFRPPQESAQQPVVILEAQMAADTGFLRRLYLESAMLLDQEPGIDHWRVVVICPHRHLNFGRELAVAEFLRERLHWIELESAAADPAAPPLLRALALLVEPEEPVRPIPEGALRHGRHHPGGSEPERGLSGDLRAGPTGARQEGLQEGRQEGRQEGELEVTLRLLRRRCGKLSPDHEGRIRSLPLAQLEALAEALLDFEGPEDLAAWLAAGG